MAIQKISKQQLDLSRELNLERLQEYATLALRSQKQQEVGTNAYYALMMALHWLEITELDYKTTCHTEVIDTELKTTLSNLLEADIIDQRCESEAWVIFYYWIVSYWSSDPDSSHLHSIKNVLLGFLGFFSARVGEQLKSLPEKSAAELRFLADEELSTLLVEVKHLFDTQDVGQW